MKYECRKSRDCDACSYHDLIYNFWIASNAQISLPIYGDEPGQVRKSGDSKVSESQITIINALVA